MEMQCLLRTESGVEHVLTLRFSCATGVRVDGVRGPEVEIISKIGKRKKTATKLRIVVVLCAQLDLCAYYDTQESQGSSIRSFYLPKLLTCTQFFFHITLG